MIDKKYNVELTRNEIRMIKIALWMEAERREDMHNSKAKDYENLSDFFNEILMKLD